MNANGIPRPPVQRISLVQLLVLPLPVLLVWWMSGTVAAQSFFAGALIAILPQAWFAIRVFRFRGARAATQLVRSALSGEVGKFFLSVAGFAAVFSLLRPIDGPAVFGGYMAMLAVQISGGWLLLRSSNRSTRTETEAQARVAIHGRRKPDSL